MTLETKPPEMSWRQWDRHQTCARKIRYEDWEDARKAGLLVSIESPQGANAPTAYPCDVIGEPHYHCGHMTVARKRWRQPRAVA